LTISAAARTSSTWLMVPYDSILPEYNSFPQFRSVISHQFSRRGGSVASLQPSAISYQPKRWGWGLGQFWILDFALPLPLCRPPAAYCLLFFPSS